MSIITPEKVTRYFRDLEPGEYVLLNTRPPLRNRPATVIKRQRNGRTYWVRLECGPVLEVDRDILTPCRGEQHSITVEVYRAR